MLFFRLTLPIQNKVVLLHKIITYKKRNVKERHTRSHKRGKKNIASIKNGAQITESVDLSSIETMLKSCLIKDNPF